MVKKEKIEEIILKISDEIIKNEEYLTDLDRKIGDGDHGVNMARGFAEIKNQVQLLKDLSLSDLFKKMGMILLTKVGGASGAIYGTAFMSAGTNLMSKEDITDKTIVDILKSMIDGIQKRGKAVKGEKTMLDTIIPVYDYLLENIDKESKEKLKENIVDVARKSMESTKDILATKGRASYLGERSMGHLDPGAVSSYLMIKVFCENL